MDRPQLRFLVTGLIAFRHRSHHHFTSASTQSTPNTSLFLAVDFDRMACWLLLLLILVASCSSFKLKNSGLIGNKGKWKTFQLHNPRLAPCHKSVARVSTELRANTLQDTTPFSSSSSVAVNFVRELYNQYGLFVLAFPAALAGAVWTYYVRKVLKNKPTIYECDKCGNQLRAPAGKSRLVLDRPGFKCPRCHSNMDSYFDINGWDLRAARRKARIQAEEAARNKYVDMKAEKIRAAAEYAAMRATAKAREVEGQRTDEAPSGELKVEEEES